MLIAILLAAAISPAAQKLKHDAEERARTDAADLLKTLCPEQCVLLSVEAKVEEEDLGTPAAPGFETPSARTVPALRGVTASLVIDQRLPAAFRSRLKILVGQRLRGQGVPATVALEQVPFPPRNPAYLEAQQPPPALGPQAALPAGAPPSVQAAGLAPAPAAPLHALNDKLVENAPLLAVVTMLSAVLLVLGGLLVIALRRQEPAMYEPLPAEPPMPSQGAATPAEAVPDARLRRLEKQLVEQRGLRNSVLREALGRNEAALVAAWLREFGDPLLDDLRGDAALAQALAAVARELSKPLADAQRASAVQELESRLLAVRLSRGSEADAFAFLDGARADNFAAALRALSHGAQDVALRFAPQHLRAAALRELDPARREELAVAWTRKSDVSATYVRTVANELRQKLADVAGGPGHSERAMIDLLDALPRSEQDALAERLRREGFQTQLWTESALAHGPADAIGAVLVSVEPRVVVDYLAGADEAVQKQLLAACPQRARKELEEELRLRGAFVPEAFLAARRELLSRLREEMLRRGQELPEPRASKPKVVTL